MNTKPSKRKTRSLKKRILLPLSKSEARCKEVLQRLSAVNGGGIPRLMDVASELEVVPSRITALTAALRDKGHMAERLEFFA